jgi:hypothetical protein
VKAGEIEHRFSEKIQQKMFHIHTVEVCCRILMIPENLHSHAATLWNQHRQIARGSATPHCYGGGRHQIVPPRFDARADRGRGRLGQFPRHREDEVVEGRGCALERDQRDKGVVAAIAVELHLHIVADEQQPDEPIGEGIR